jgi:hypothetical protein
MSSLLSILLPSRFFRLNLRSLRRRLLPRSHRRTCALAHRRREGRGKARRNLPVFRHFETICRPPPESLTQHRYDELSAKALGKAITQDLQGVHRNHHLDVFASADYFKQASDDSGDEPTPASRAREIEDGRAVDLGFTAIEIDPAASVAYIASRTQWFDNQGALEMAAHAMNMASYSKNIIVDLRGNLGGSGRMGRFLVS